MSDESEQRDWSDAGLESLRRSYTGDESEDREWTTANYITMPMPERWTVRRCRPRDPWYGRWVDWLFPAAMIAWLWLLISWGAGCTLHVHLITLEGQGAMRLKAPASQPANDIQTPQEIVDELINRNGGRP